MKSYVTPYTFGLAILMVGLTLSPFLMSLAQFWLLTVWLIDGVRLRQPVGKVFQDIWFNIRTKLGLFWRNKVAVVVVSLYVMHVVGLLWTSDFAYALKDLRVKLPLLILPLVMSTMPALDKKQAKALLAVYVAAVFVATLISFHKYLTSSYTDIRQISSFISHIRFSLNIVLCICVLLYCVARESVLWVRLVSLAVVCWFLVQVYIMQVLSAYVILFAVFVFSAFYALFRSRLSKTVKITLSVVSLLLVVVVSALLARSFMALYNVEKVDFESLPKTTALGNYYYHDTIYTGVEDGRYIGLYYCEDELREAWNKRSDVPFDDTIASGAAVKHLLMRYMTSKNLAKDAAGMAQMSDDDVQNVVNGVANYNNFVSKGLRSRISITAFELNIYRWSGNPNGGSVSQRFEYNKASLYLIRQHPLFGVGTGDIPNAYQQAYRDLDSQLDEQHRYKAHNQYMSITVGFGIIGLLMFLFSLFYPVIKSKNKRNYMYLSFLLIILLSMLPEDTIETQAGATFFAFFNAFFLFALPD